MAAAFTAFDSTVGTYSYTLTCTSGPISVTNTLSATFESNAPYTTLTVDKTTEPYTGTAADTITLTWNSNLTLCEPSVTPNAGSFTTTGSAGGTGTWYPGTPGTYTMTMSCYASGTTSPVATSAPVIIQVQPPPAPTASISIVPAAVSINQTFTVSWSSNYAQFCTSTGGTPNDAFEITQAVGSGSYVSSAPGQFTFAVDCPSIGGVKPDGTAQATVTVTGPAPTVALAISPSNVVQGSTFTLSWSSTNSSTCTASGGGASNSPWSGMVATTNAGLVMSADNVGTFTYTLNCANGNLTGQGQATVIVSAPAAPTATLSSDRGSYTTGQTITLTWSSTNATTCTASGGGANGSAWAGAIGTSGTATQTATTPGTFTYTDTCSAGNQSAQAQATVTVNNPATGGAGNSGSGGHGGGGGGAFDLSALAALGTVLAIRSRRRSPIDPQLYDRIRQG
jgi:hypothetical protein